MPDTYSKAKGKKVISKEVTWYSTDTSIATVNKSGMVTAGAKEGVCKIYARAHNGRKSNQFTITVENYAKPAQDKLDLDTAYQNQEVYGNIIEMFVNYYQAVTDIAEYFCVNRPKDNEVFSCWIREGKVKMYPENAVSGKIKQTIYNIVKDFPSDMCILADSNQVLFRSCIADRRYVTVSYLYDKNSVNEGNYREQYNLAKYWTYGEIDYGR